MVKTKTLLLIVILNGIYFPASAGQIDSLVKASSLALAHGDRDEAKVLAYNAHQLAESLGSRKDLALTHLTCANAYQATGNFQSADGHYQDAIELADLLNYDEVLGKALTSYGLLKIKQNLFNEGESSIRQAIELAQKVGDTTAIASAYEHLGRSKLMQEKFSEAVDLYKKSLEQAELLNDSGRIAINNQNLALTYFKMGDPDKAKECINKSLTIRIKRKDEMYIRQCYTILQKIETGDKRIDDALNTQAVYYTTINKMGMSLDSLSIDHQARIATDMATHYQDEQRKYTYTSLVAAIMGCLSILLAVWWYRDNKRINASPPVTIRHTAPSPLPLNGLRKEERRETLKEHLKPLYDRDAPHYILTYVYLMLKMPVNTIADVLKKHRTTVSGWIPKIKEIYQVDDIKVYAASQNFSTQEIIEILTEITIDRIKEY